MRDDEYVDHRRSVQRWLDERRMRSAADRPESFWNTARPPQIGDDSNNSNGFHHGKDAEDEGQMSEIKRVR